jgi:hypothetical protein
MFARFITKLGSINLVLWGSACAGLANVCFGFVSKIEPGTANLKLTRNSEQNKQIKVGTFSTPTVTRCAPLSVVRIHKSNISGPDQGS